MFCNLSQQRSIEETANAAIFLVQFNLIILGPKTGLVGKGNVNAWRNLRWGLITPGLTVFQVCIEVTDYLVCKPCCGKRRKLELNLAIFTETEVIAWFNLSDEDSSAGRYPGAN